VAAILVVDDDPDICALLQFKLEGSGHTVLVERDGEAALSAIDRESVDLVLLDWMMPRMSGLEVCLALRERPVRPPVLLLTAKGQEKDVERGLAVGADDYILKPFSPREIVARIATALARSAG